MDKLLASNQRQPTGLAAAERVNAPPTQAGAPLASNDQSKATTGKSLPDVVAASASSVAASDPKVLVDAVQKVNDYAKAQHRAVRFAVDQELGRPVVKVLDSSDTVVRQIPTEVVIRLARNLEEYSAEANGSAASSGNGDSPAAKQALDNLIGQHAGQPDAPVSPGQVINTIA